MKILLVSSKYQPEYSGSGFRAHNTYKRLEKDYPLTFDVLSNSINFQGNRNYTHEDKEVYCISSPYKIPSNKSLIRNILIIVGMLWEIFYTWKYIRKNIGQYDLLHTFGNSWSIGLLTLYFSWKKKPIIRELCNEMPNPLYPIQIQSMIKKVFQKDNTLVVAISLRLERLARKFGMKHIWTRPNPIDEKKYFVANNKYTLRNKLCKFGEDDIVLSLIANYIDRKNQLFALEVLKKLPTQYKLVLAGPLKNEGKKYYDKVLSKIKLWGLEDRVDITNGFVENFDEYLKMSDVFLFPSKAEGLGTPLLEAQACAIPVVSNDIEGISDMVIKPGKGGYYHDFDVPLWTEAIIKAASIPHEVLLENVDFIRSISAHSIIDKEYFEKIKKLIND